LFLFVVWHDEKHFEAGVLLLFLRPVSVVFNHLIGILFEAESHLQGVNVAALLYPEHVPDQVAQVALPLCGGVVEVVHDENPGAAGHLECRLGNHLSFRVDSHDFEHEFHRVVPLHLR